MRQLLSHQAGLHSMAGLVDGPGDLLDHVAMEERLAARSPDPWPGHPGYHAITYGWLLAGLARRITGLGMKELVRQEFATPLGTDGLGIGMPPTARPVSCPADRPDPARASHPTVLLPDERRLHADAAEGRADPPVPRRVLYVPHFDEVLSGSSPPVLHTEMPSVNGVFSAQGLATLYAATSPGAARWTASDSCCCPPWPPWPKCKQGPRRRHRHAHELAHGLPPGRRPRVPR